MQIEKNIPLPGDKLPHAKYPWDEMEVGDSFFANAEPSSLRSCARYQAGKKGHRYTIRKEGEGTRVWRTA